MMNNQTVVSIEPKQAQRALAKLKSMTPEEVEQVVEAGNEAWQTIGGLLDKEYPYFEGKHGEALQILVDVFCGVADEHVAGYESPESWDDETDY